MLPKQLVIIGGGASLRPYWDGVYKEKGLFELLPKLFSCGLNYSYKFINTTLNSGVDETFYNANSKELVNLPLYIGKEQVSLQKSNTKNVYFFPPNRKYDRDLIGGVYKSTLAGLFALSLFIKFMDEGEIYLLGYDYGPQRDSYGKPLIDERGRILTHWYQGKCEHRGIGKINWYTATMTDSKDKKTKITNAENEFRVFANESKVKIYNVGLQSAIPTFEKISYESFFSKILITEHNQNEIREELIKKCEHLQYQFALEKSLKNTKTLTNIENKRKPFTC